MRFNVETLMLAFEGLSIDSKLKSILKNQNLFDSVHYMSYLIRYIHSNDYNIQFELYTL